MAILKCVLKDADLESFDFRCEVGAEVGYGLARGGPVVWIETRDHTQHQGRILNRPGHGTQMIEGPAERHHTAPADPAIGRHKTDDVVVRGGKPDRTAGIRTDGAGTKAGCHGRSGAAA